MSVWHVGVSATSLHALDRAASPSAATAAVGWGGRSAPGSLGRLRSRHGADVAWSSSVFSVIIFLRKSRARTMECVGLTKGCRPCSVTAAHPRRTGQDQDAEDIIKSGKFHPSIEKRLIDRQAEPPLDQNARCAQVAQNMQRMRESLDKVMDDNALDALVYSTWAFCRRPQHALATTARFVAPDRVPRGITPAMAMRVPGIGSQYLFHAGCRQELLRRLQDLQGDAAQGHSGGEFLVVDALRQPVALDARHAAAPPACGQPKLSIARCRGEPRRLHNGVFQSQRARGVKGGTGSRPSGKGWNTLLRLYSPLEPFFTKEWRPSEIEQVSEGAGGRALR